MPRLRSVGLEFFNSPPAEVVTAKTLDCSAERVFEVLADPPGWPQWFDGMKSGAWTSPAPFGVGSTRRMGLASTTVDETFLAWEPGVRFTFRLDAMGLPIVRAMAEDWRIESLGPKSCRVTYRVAYEPTLLARLLHPVLRAMFTRQFARSVDTLAAFVRNS